MKGGIIERAMVEWRIVTAVCAVLLGIGMVAFFTMPRQEFPEFTVRTGLVVGAFLGLGLAEHSHESEDEV